MAVIGDSRPSLDHYRATQAQNRRYRRAMREMQAALRTRDLMIEHLRRPDQSLVRDHSRLHTENQALREAARTVRLTGVLIGWGMATVLVALFAVYGALR